MRMSGIFLHIIKENDCVLDCKQMMVYTARKLVSNDKDKLMHFEG